MIYTQISIVTAWILSAAVWSPGIFFFEHRSHSIRDPVFRCQSENGRSFTFGRTEDVLKQESVSGPFNGPFSFSLKLSGPCESRSP